MVLVACHNSEVDAFVSVSVSVVVPVLFPIGRSVLVLVLGVGVVVVGGRGGSTEVVLKPRVSGCFFFAFLPMLCSALLCCAVLS